MTTEQMTVAGLEQQGTAQEQPSEAVAAATEAAVAEAVDRAVAEYDLSTPEGVRAAADTFPALKAVFADYENTGRQRTLAEMRREQGANDRATAYHAELLRQLEEGADPRELAKQTPGYVKANEDWTRAEVLRGLIAKARELDEDAVAPLAELAESLQGNPDEIEKVAQAAINAVANKSGAAARQALFDIESLDEIPKDSRLYAHVQSLIAKETETEVNARTTEANTLPPMPSTPSGTAAEPMTKARYEAMSSADRKQFIEGERARTGNTDSVWDLITAQPS